MVLSITPVDDVTIDKPGTGSLIMDFNFGLLAGNASDRYIALSEKNHIPLESRLKETDTNKVELVDEWTGVRIVIKTPGGSRMSTYPVKTLSRGEGGLELNYQGVCVQFKSKVSLRKGTTEQFKAIIGIHSL